MLIALALGRLRQEDQFNQDQPKLSLSISNLHSLSDQKRIVTKYIKKYSLVGSPLQKPMSLLYGQCRWRQESQWDQIESRNRHGQLQGKCPIKLVRKSRRLSEFQSLEPLRKWLEPEKMKNAFFELGL